MNRKRFSSARAKIERQARLRHEKLSSTDLTYHSDFNFSERSNQTIQFITVVGTIRPEN